MSTSVRPSRPSGVLDSSMSAARVSSPSSDGDMLCPVVLALETGRLWAGRQEENGARRAVPSSSRLMKHRRL